METEQGPCGGDGDTTLAATRDVRGQRLTSGGRRNDCAGRFMVQGTPTTFYAAIAQERPPKGEVRRCPARCALGSGRRGEVRRSGSSKTDPALAGNLQGVIFAMSLPPSCPPPEEGKGKSGGGEGQVRFRQSRAGFGVGELRRQRCPAVLFWWARDLCGKPVITFPHPAQALIARGDQFD